MNISLMNIQVKLPFRDKVLFNLPKLEIQSGEKILLIGESGKGKTTLLHLIAGLFLPARGQVTIGNFELSQLNDVQRCEFRRQHIGLIFQKLNLIEHLTAFENVQLGLRERTDLPRVQKSLEAVGLKGMMDLRSSVLSLGEQQRVAVARVLASDAQILMADEPTSSLDGKNADNVIDLLLKASQGKSLIVVSHDHRIESHFDRVLQFESLVRR